MERFLQSIGVAAWAWRSAVSLALRSTIWLPFLLVGGVQTAVLLIVVSFHCPAVLPVGLPLIRLLVGDAAAHYPVLYYALPAMFFRVNLAVSVLIASIAAGAATLLFAKAFGFAQEQGAWNRAPRCAPR